MDQLIATLVERDFPCSTAELHISDLPISAVVAAHGTPLYLYDQNILARKWALLRGALPPQFAVSYSMKANPNPALLRYFLGKGCGLEVASGGELFQALHAGCPPDKILFAGPGKTTAELELALTRGIGEIHVESLLELERIQQLCQQYGVRGRVGLRINPTGEVQGGAQRMGGKAAPFGLDEECLDEALAALATYPALDFGGLHLYVGTQILDHTTLLNQYRKGLEIARRVALFRQQPTPLVDFGGGLGIPYFSGEQELDMAAFRCGLQMLMDEVTADPWLAETRFMVEPGRYLVGDAGIYVVRITDIKISRGKKFLIVDGGMSHHLAASGNLGQVIKRNFPLAVLNRLTVPAVETVDIAGPLCTPLDVIGRGVTLPETAVGDLIGVFQSGAYARAASPLGFLSHLTPPEVLVADGCATLIRRRGRYEDYLHDLQVA
ncbi:MAG: type III PLP-dependent enzyme [Caldilinea sp. CFX5]|nr:type III PLP-dependent enzyme [Caldilinea sp. CFX5]